MLRPDLEERDCLHCLKNLYHESGDKQGQLATHDGVAVKRVPGKPAPCRTKAGCMKGMSEKLNVLTPQNERAIQFSRRCEVTGRWPEDEIVINTATLIRRIEKMVESQEQTKRIADAVADGVVAALFSSGR